MEVTIALFVFAIIAGLIKGFSGFGLTLILVSVLFEMGFSANEFLPIFVPLFVILDLILYFENRKHLTLNFKENFTIHHVTIMTLFLGTMFGAYLLNVVDTSYLKLGLGILIIVLLFMLVAKVDNEEMIIPDEKQNGFFGFFTGLLTGLFTMNGIPVTIYLMFHQYNKEKYMANLVTFLLFSDIILIAVYLFSDMFTLAGFIVSIKLVFMVLFGFFAGIFLRKFVSNKMFKGIVVFILMLSAVNMIFTFFFK